VVVTPVGAIRATIVARDVTSTAARLGVGLVVGADELPKSWSSALIALRLTSARHPVVDAEGLGSMMALAEVSDTRPPTPDVAAIERLDERDQKAITTLEAIVANDSLRAAATEVGVHHSTMQARAAELSVALGYDLRTAPGRTRLSLALSLLTLSRNRFD
jgi:sugar diacid utilization regulator